MNRLPLLLSMVCVLPLVTACDGEDEVPDAGPSTLLVTGADQIGNVGERLPENVTVALRRPDGTMANSFPFSITTVSGFLSVRVPGTGSVGGNGATLNGTATNGLLTLEVTLGQQPGTASLEIDVPGTELVQDPRIVYFHGQAGPVARILRSGDGQVGAAGQPLGLDLVLIVQDRFGNPIADVEVTWSPAAGSVDPATSVTAEHGGARTIWTLGPEPGTQTLDAEIGGLGRFRFQATAIAPA